MPVSVDLDLANTCILLNTGPGELCVDIFGAKLCAQVGYEIGDPTTIVESMLAQINTALVPLGPFFDILDFVKAAMDCISAIPDSLGPPPDPTAVLACIPALTTAVNKLLQLIPPFPIFVMVKGILMVIITGLQGLKAKLASLIAQVARILQASLRAAELGNFQLQAVVDCANGNLSAQLQNLNSQMAPLNRLIGVVNALLELAGLDCIPALTGISEISEDALAPLQAIIDFLLAIYAAIPAPPTVLAPIQPGACL